jgi:hypothetical protein
LQVEILPMELDPFSFSNDPHDRSDGLHLSTVMDSLENALEPDKYKNSFFNLSVCSTFGFVWERVLEREVVHARVDAGFLFRPGEVSRDGIVGTPDGYDVDGILEEWKCTWKSSKRDVHSFTRYLWQVKAYCHMLGVNQVNLRILFVVGAYWGEGPSCVCYHLTFSKREMVQNWNMILGHARDKGWVE